jgi:hypothetical protein
VSWLRSFELLSHLNTSAVVLFAGAFLLGIFFAYVYQQKRQAYLLVWASAWSLVSLYFVRSAFAGPAPVSMWVSVFSEWVMALAALAFYCSARLYARLTLSPRRIAFAAAVAAVWSFAYPRDWIAIPLAFGVVVVFFLTAQVFWQEGRKQEARADKLLASTFVATGALRLLFIFQAHLGPLAGANLQPFALLAEIIGGVLMLMAV